MTDQSKCGFVAIVGAPNAGKSTLLNRLTGAKLSIVSPKAQTTRFRVLGILMRGSAQILLVDTPGIFPPRRKLDRAMVKAAWTGSADADITILLVDAQKGATEGVARNPGAAGTVQTIMIIALALIESLVLFALLIVFVVLR